MNILQILLLALFAAFAVLRLLGRGWTVSRFARWTVWARTGSAWRGSTP